MIIVRNINRPFNPLSEYNYHERINKITGRRYKITQIDLPGLYFRNESLKKILDVDIKEHNIKRKSIREISGFGEVNKFKSNIENTRDVFLILAKNNDTENILFKTITELLFEGNRMSLSERSSLSALILKNEMINQHLRRELSSLSAERKVLSENNNILESKLNQLYSESESVRSLREGFGFRPLSARIGGKAYSD